MGRYSRMSIKELHEGIATTEDTIQTEVAYLKQLEAGFGLPTDRFAREELIQSHRKVLQKLKEDLEQLELELSKRRETGA